MKYRHTGVYEELASFTSLVRWSTEYPIQDFDCGVEDYNHFLKQDAEQYEKMKVSSVHLLIHNETQEVLGYIGLLADSFLLDKQEKEREGLQIPFNSVPALKIGKLAVSKRHFGPYGSFLLELSLGFAQSLIETGVACRYLIVDADTEFDERTPEFYEKNGFVYNGHRQYRNRTAVSMRYDFFDH